MRERKDLLGEVGGQHVFWLEGNQIKSVGELKAALVHLDNVSFSKYVNAFKNDFYNWVRDVHQHKELAAELIDCQTKDAVVASLEKWMARAERANKEREVVERVVKAKILELNNIPGAKDNFVDARMVDPLFLLGTKVRDIRTHPKNIPDAVPVPKLWELRPVRKIERKARSFPKSEVGQVRLSDLVHAKLERAERKIEIKEVKRVEVVYHTEKSEVKFNPVAIMKSSSSKRVSAHDAETLVEKLKEVYNVEI